MKYSILLSIFFLFSCSGKIGVKLNLSDLLSARGVANKKDNSKLDTNKEFYFYNDSKYQVDKTSLEVEAKFIKPKKEEALINYWKDKYKDTFYKIEKNEGNMEEYSMIIPSQKERIVYGDSGQVKWIIKKGEL